MFNPSCLIILLGLYFFNPIRAYAVETGSQEPSRCEIFPVVSVQQVLKAGLGRPQDYEELILRLHWHRLQLSALTPENLLSSQVQSQIDELVQRRRAVGSLFSLVHPGYRVGFYIPSSGLKHEWPQVTIVPHTLSFMARVISASTLFRDPYKPTAEQMRASLIFTDVLARIQYTEGDLTVSDPLKEEVKQFLRGCQSVSLGFTTRNIISWIQGLLDRAKSDGEFSWTATPEMALQEFEAQIRSGAIDHLDAKAKAELRLLARNIYHSLILPRISADMKLMTQPGSRSLHHLGYSQLGARWAFRAVSHLL